jgi:hypothetical protein
LNFEYQTVLKASIVFDDKNEKRNLFCLVTIIVSIFQMEHFIERLDTLLDNDPFSDLDWNLLSPNDYEVCGRDFFVRFLKNIF